MRNLKVDWYHLVPSHVKEILKRLHGAGHEAFLVGGCVRDLLLGARPKDFDLVSSASPEEVEQLFPRTEGVGRQFGIMIVVTESGPVELARFRSDGEYRDGRHPEAVLPAGPGEDALRRDFTVNALFYELRTGEVRDWVGGIDDLNQRLLRCVGEPGARFREDSLRMLRAARFHAQLARFGFRFAPGLDSAIRANAGRLELVSRERVTQELQRLLLSGHPGAGLMDLLLTGLWNPVFLAPPPAASILSRFDCLEESWAAFSGLPLPFELPLGALAHWVPGCRPESCFVLSRETKAALERLPQLLRRLPDYASFPRAQKKRLLGEELILPALCILRAAAGEELLDLLDEAAADRARWLEKGLLNPAPLLSGGDLLAAGVPAGPKVRELLEAVRTEQLSELLHSREEALRWLQAKGLLNR